MNRLVIYTSISGDIIKKFMDCSGFSEKTQHKLKIPQGWVSLKRFTLTDTVIHQKTQVWIEKDKDYLLSRDNIRELAFEIYSEDLIYESSFRI